VEEGFVDDFVDEGAFTWAADARDGDESAEGKRGWEIIYVVAGGAFDVDPRVIFFWAGPAWIGYRDGASTCEVGAGGWVCDLG